MPDAQRVRLLQPTSGAPSDRYPRQNDVLKWSGEIVPHHGDDVLIAHGETSVFVIKLLNPPNVITVQPHTIQQLLMQQPSRGALASARHAIDYDQLGAHSIPFRSMDNVQLDLRFEPCEARFET